LQRVELGVELVGRAAERAGGLAARGLGEVRAREGEVRVRVEQRAVVDAHGIHRFVLDNGAVHERAGVAQRGVVQLAGRDPARHCLGQLRGDVVHVGETVGERGGDLALGRALGDARPDRLRERELAA
jgi:hypothetical protein